MPVVRMDGLSGRRSVGRSVYSHVITKFSRMGRLLHFLTHVAPLARFVRESSAITYYLPFSEQHSFYCAVNRVNISHEKFTQVNRTASTATVSQAFNSPKFSS